MNFGTYDELKTAIEDTIDELTETPGFYNPNAMAAAIGTRQDDGSWEIPDALIEQEIKDLLEENMYETFTCGVEIGPDFLGAVVSNPDGGFVEEFEFPVTDDASRSKTLVSGLSSHGYHVVDSSQPNILTLKLM